MPVGPLPPAPAPLPSLPPPPPPMLTLPALPGGMPAAPGPMPGSPAPLPYRPDAYVPTAPSQPAPVPPVAASGLAGQLQGALVALADKLFPLKPQAQPGVQATATLGDKLRQVGRAAIFFALPVGGAALVACGLGWLVGPFVPFVGGHVFGAVAATLAVGHTAGMLLHGAMRLPLVTKPEEREVNSAGVTLASAGLGAAFAGGIAALAGASVTPWLLLGGAALGAAPRVFEWLGGRSLT